MHSRIMLAFAVVALMVVAGSAQQTSLNTPAGTFTTQSNVGQQLGVSATVSTVLDQLSSQDFEGIRQTYDNSDLLKSYGMGTGLSGPVFEQARAFFGGSAAFNDEYINTAFQNPQEPAKMEMLQKTMMDAIPVQGILSLANAGRSNNQESWDQACALFMGSNQNREATPYERAEKRAANFGTSSGNAATVNVNILQACSAGPSEANYETILENIKVLYAQASIRYARLLDVDYEQDLSTVDHRAEGQAFYRIIAPFVSAANSACHNTMDQLYNFDKTPVPGVQYYCEAVSCIPSALGITQTQVGTLEDTEGVCDGTAAIETAAGTFNPQSPVFEQLQVSATVNSILEYLSNDNYAEAENAYTNSGLLQSYGKGEGLSGPVFQQAESFFGSSDFNDKYLIDEAFTEEEDAAKSEMVEKTVMDAIPVQAILSLSYAGRSGDRDSWDKACALYVGRPHLESSIYERAEKRAANYGTTNSGVARVNKAVLDACANPSSANYEIILESIKIIYAQATIRYAHLLDIDFREGLSTADHRAEGQAFYRIIAPMVNAADSTCHATLDELYNFSKNPDPSKIYYCEAVACVPDALDLTVTDIGVLEDTQGVCGGGSGMMNNGNDDSSASTLRVAAALFLSAAVALML